MSESLFSKVTGIYPATLLTEKTPIHFFFILMNFVRYLRQLFNVTLPGDCFSSTEKYFINEIANSHLKKKKKKKRKKWRRDV